MVDRDERIGLVLRRLREDRSMTQAEVAQALADQGIEGMYPQTVVKLEAGTRALKFQEGLALARIFGVDPNELANFQELTPIDRQAVVWAQALSKDKAALDELLSSVLIHRKYGEAVLTRDPSPALRKRLEELMAATDLEERWRNHPVTRLTETEEYRDLFVEATARNAEEGVADDGQHQAEV